MKRVKQAIQRLTLRNFYAAQNSICANGEMINEFEESIKKCLLKLSAKEILQRSHKRLAAVFRLLLAAGIKIGLKRKEKHVNRHKN